jgi:hypothetical protein
MKYSIITIIITLIALSIHAQLHNPIWHWTRQGGGTGFDEGRGIVFDGYGNIFIAGDFTNDATFNDTTIISAGSEDVFIAKYDTNGSLLWIHQDGGAGFDRVNFTTTDNNGNCIIIGRFNGIATFGDSTFTSNGGDDVFIIKYDNNGNFLWAEQAGGSGNDRGNSIETDNFGNIVCTGRFEVSAIFGDTTIVSAGSEDIFIAKYNSNGDFLWAKQEGGSGIDRGHSIDTDVLDNIIITGRFELSASIGDSVFSSAGLWDIFIAVYNNNGEFLWAEQAGGAGNDCGFGIKTDNLNNIFVTGEFENEAFFGDTSLTCLGVQDAFFVKYDSNGRICWLQGAGGPGIDWGWGIDVTNVGQCIATGKFSFSASFGDTTLTSLGQGDIFAVIYDSLGNMEWIWQAGGSGDEFGFRVDTYGFDNILITGPFTSDTTIGDTMLTCHGSYDMFLVKFKEPPTGIKNNMLKSSDGFRLYANYPNPFNPTTTIEFDLPKTSKVTLKVFNILGEEVAILLSASLLSGSHSVDWDASNLASGVYLYRLQAGGYVETRKMVLMR